MQTSDLSRISSGQSPEMAADRKWLAHDVRNALQGVLGGVLQLEGAEVSADMRVQLDRIAASAKTLTHLVGAMLGETPDTQGACGASVVDLRRFLRNLRLRWSGEAHQARVNLHIEGADDMPEALRIDLVSLVRILGNLISNSIRHATAMDGTAMVRLIVGADRQGGVEFRLTDNGTGLSDAVLAKVFGADRAPDGHEKAGHGLGLHIVKALTEGAGGAFSLAHRRGGGVEARVRFPADLCVAECVAPALPGAGGAERLDLHGLRILLAEDNPTNQMVATQMLQALNARVTITSDGVEALERFEAATFDLLVVDIEMPRLSGLDVIRTIRGRSDARARVPIIALTAYALREHRDRIAEAGANGLISKPITSIDALGRTLLAHAAPEPVRPAESADGAEAAEPVIDRGIYDALCQAIGPDMMAELLEKVVADLGAVRLGLAETLTSSDCKPVRANSHILISVAGAIGATRLQRYAQSLNAVAHGDNAAAMAGQIHCCLVEIDAAVEFVESRRAAG